MGKFPLKTRHGSWIWWDLLLIGAEHLRCYGSSCPFQVGCGFPGGAGGGLIPSSASLAMSAVRGALSWSQILRLWLVGLITGLR